MPHSYASSFALELRWRPTNQEAVTMATPIKMATQICKSSGRYCQLYGIGFIAAQSGKFPNEDCAHFHEKNSFPTEKGTGLSLGFRPHPVKVRRHTGACRVW